jgi:serine/threonine protein phosphatase PrpC
MEYRLTSFISNLLRKHHHHYQAVSPVSCRAITPKKDKDGLDRDTIDQIQALAIALGDSSFEPPQVHKQSFILKRCSKDGSVVGPEALFGRHNISILMTRSVGDRYGPRCCIALPEISAYTVPVDTHCRFVLGSDGFWDVVSIETVRCLGLLDINKDPRRLSSHLAHKAHRRRERAKMRMDDISVLIVDINPNNFIGINGKNGGDMMGKNGSVDKEKCTIS